MKHKGFEIECYDTITKLPVHRYFEYNRHVAIDVGIGSDMRAFQERGQNFINLVDSDPNAAKQEMRNMMQAVQFVISNTHPKMNSFVVLIKSIDGKPFTDSNLTDEGIKSTIQKLGKRGLTIGMVDDFLSMIKKKFNFEFEQFFPKLSDNASIKEQFSQLQTRTLLLIEEMTKEVNNSKLISQIDQYLLSKYKPQNFSGQEGVEVKSIQGFEKMCLAIESNGMSNDAKNMTTLAFFNAMEILRANKPKR